MQVIIDRFEGEFAVVELPDGSRALLSRTLVQGAKEGDVLSITLDAGASAQRKQAIDELMNDLFAD